MKQQRVIGLVPYCIRPYRIERERERGRMKRKYILIFENKGVQGYIYIHAEGLSKNKHNK